MRGCVAKARGGGCDLDEVYDLEHELEHHGGIHVAAGGGNEVADGRVSARGRRNNNCVSTTGEGNLTRVGRTG